MLSISLWAKNHKWTTRFLIVFVLYPLLNITGFILGDLISSFGFEAGPDWYYLFCATALIILIGYPSARAAYRHRKTMDCLMALSSFCIIVVFGNRMEVSAPAFSVTNDVAAATVTDSKPAKLKKEKKKSLRKMIQQVRKKYRDADSGTRTVLIILSVILAIAVIFGLGALACTIACNGSEALALILFILGTVGVIGGLVAVIRSIKRSYPKGEKQNIHSR